MKNRTEPSKIRRLRNPAAYYKDMKNQRILSASLLTLRQMRTSPDMSEVAEGPLAESVLVEGAGQGPEVAGARQHCLSIRDL